MRELIVYEEYSEDKEYKFEIYHDTTYFQVWVQKKVTDDYMGDGWFEYHDISDYKHSADTLERAIEIGRECLRCLI